MITDDCLGSNSNVDFLSHHSVAPHRACQRRPCAALARTSTEVFKRAFFDACEYIYIYIGLLRDARDDEAFLI